MKSLLFLSLFICVVSFSTYANESSSVSVTDFFKRPSISSIELSPNGKLIAYEKYGEIFIGMGSELVSSIYSVNSGYYISRLTWIANDTIAFRTSNRDTNESSYWFVKVEAVEDSLEIVKHELIDSDGYIVDKLPYEEDTILYGNYKRGDEGVYSDIHKIKLFTGKTYRFQKRKKYNKNSGKILTWVTDQNSQIRAGISYADSKPTLWVRSHKKSLRMEPLWTGDKKTFIAVYGVNQAKTKLWAVTDYKSDLKVAVEFDLTQSGVYKILYQHEQRDVNRILMDTDGNAPLAISYLEEGILNYHIIDSDLEKTLNSIKAQYPDLKHTVYDSTPDAKTMLLAQYGMQEPGRIIYCKFSEACSEVSSLYPAIAGIQLGQTEVFNTVSPDGVEIESFLTIPNNTNTALKSSVPLIIMPHGGPIGISDTRFFDAGVEWLAHNGFAVLRVNYRGSGSFGKDFKLSGMQQWGRAIENDIDSALDNALTSFDFLDANNMCLFGGSYGGYSALISIIRSPKRYRCAISFAGVSDLPLLFNRSSVIGNDELTLTLKQMIGDPNSQMDELIRYSPVYNAEKIETPTMLIHGTRDNIVDVEHTWRMSEMLSMLGIPHERHIVDDLGHSYRNTEQVAEVYGWIMPFLDRYLKDSDSKSEVIN